MLYAEEKTALDDLLKQLSPMGQEMIEFWLRFGPSYQDIAEALDTDAKTLRTRFHRAVQRLKHLMNEKQMRESDLRRWLHANLLALEQEGGKWPREFSIREYLRGEAYANRFGGHPIRWQFETEDDDIPDAWLPPSYWN